MKESTFFATVSRMKYINRWALMRNSREENLSEHSLDVAMIAHGLCVIGNARFGKQLKAERAALLGLYHDVSEIITGDMPTPVKYYNSELHDAYKNVEHAAEERLCGLLPEDLRSSYQNIFREKPDNPEEKYIRRLVKAADKLSAYVKCIEEERSGNTEFSSAAKTTYKSLVEMAAELPELKIFMEEFLPAYGKTLDELNGRD